ncbi:Hok/Gef family protein [Rouxiella sp. T17]|uniref:Hok/Gef family protein n=1 Tax=Rouxiella sp. T17 TaxID=3085684 RepID=UPI002FC7F80F
MLGIEREKPRIVFIKQSGGATLNTRNIKVAPHLLNCKIKGAKMPYKLIFAVSLLICLTLSLIVLITQNTLCELQFKNESTEVAAYLACEAVR